MVVLQPCASNTKLVVLARPVTNTRLVNRKETLWLDAAGIGNWYLLQNKGSPLRRNHQGAVNYKADETTAKY